jgi:hypothetical protein
MAQQCNYAGNLRLLDGRLPGGLTVTTTALRLGFCFIGTNFVLHRRNIHVLNRWQLILDECSVH